MHLSGSKDAVMSKCNWKTKLDFFSIGSVLHIAVLLFFSSRGPQAGEDPEQVASKAVEMFHH